MSLFHPPFFFPQTIFSPPPPLPADHSLTPPLSPDGSLSVSVPKETRHKVPHVSFPSSISQPVFSPPTLSRQITLLPPPVFSRRITLCMCVERDKDMNTRCMREEAVRSEKRHERTLGALRTEMGHDVRRHGAR